MGALDGPSDQRNKNPGWVRAVASGREENLPKGKWMELLKKSSSFAALLRAYVCGVNHGAWIELKKRKSVILSNLFLLSMLAMYMLVSVMGQIFVEIHVEISTPNVMVLEDAAFVRWVSDDGRALLSGINALTEGVPRERSSFSPAMWRNSEKLAPSARRSGLSPDTKFASVLILGFPSLQNGEK